MKIRELKETDIKEIADLHLNCLPDTVSSKLGTFYLEKIYYTFAKSRHCFSLLAVENGKIIGVIAATTDLDKFQSQTKKKFTLATYLKVAKSIIMQKTSALELIKRILYEKQLVKNYQKPYLTIVALIIHSQHRRQGIASKLLKATIKKNSTKVKYFYVDTLETNQSAQKLYQGLNFKIQAKIKNSILLSLKSRK